MMDSRVILLVEDNPDDAELTRMAFEENDIVSRLVLARDGVEAIDYLFGTGPHADHPPDLPQTVLLDLKLPRIDGLEVLRRVRASERTRLLPVVILTSSKEDEDIARGYSLGANSYIRKPVSYTEFKEAARQLGLYWLVLNQSPPVARLG
jgi:two-component system response regulator